MTPTRTVRLVSAAACALSWFAAQAVPAQTVPAQTAPRAAAAGARNGRAERVQLRAVSTAATFQEVNRSDARAALKAWLDIAARQRGFSTDSSVDIAERLADMRARLENHSVELVTMGIFEYLELESSGLITPALSDVRGGQQGATYSYVLLVKAGSPATGIAQLRGTNILVHSRRGDPISTAWLEILLNREKLGRIGEFFASVKAPAKAQACILAVFFGSTDACVVDETSLKLAREMNPQLGQLRVLARSRPVLETVVALPADPHPFRRELMDALRSLHEEARGRQLLMVFGTERLVPIAPGDLEPVREIWCEYRRLAGRLPGKPAPRLEERR